MRNFHSLNSESVYGPVESRRYGLTLGVNPFTSGEKVCSFNCAYCQLGWTPAAKAGSTAHVAPDVIRRELLSSPRQLRGTNIDAIVISGNGEPTMHAQFPEMIAAVVDARDRAWSMVPLVLLTHGGRLARREVFQAATRVDECAVKLDAGSREVLLRINMPREELDLDVLVDRIRALPNSVVQSCFVEGAYTNADDASVHSWLNAIRRALPQRIDIYTVSRTPPTPAVGFVMAERLQQIAALATQAVQTKVRVFPAHEADGSCRDHRQP